MSADAVDIPAVLDDPVVIRPLRFSDRRVLAALGDVVSEKTLYLRFFSTSRPHAQRYLAALTGPCSYLRCVLVAEQGGTLVGVAGFDAVGAGRAELSVMIADQHQHVGIGTQLVEALLVEARRVGIHTFVAEVRADNAGMHLLLRDLHLEMHSSMEFGICTVTIDLGAPLPV